MIAMAFLPQNLVLPVMGITIALLLVVPYVYSYMLYRKGI